MRRVSSAVFVLLLVAVPALAQTPQLRAEFVVSGLRAPLAFVQDPSQPDVQFIVEKAGRIRVLEGGVLQPTPFLDLSSKVETYSEQGMVGLAFAPDYATSGRFFVSYVMKDPMASNVGNTIIGRFTRDAQNPLLADVTSEVDLVWPDGNPFLTQFAEHHKGGNMMFGWDGMLYIGVGDGDLGFNPHNSAQDPMTLLGKMIRIDVSVPDSDPEGYDVPLDNPFVGRDDVLPEIWAFGVRNPWRWSFDDGPGGTNALVMADVGESDWEEINYEPARAGGRNYGWGVREGAHDTQSELPPFSESFTDPIFEYSHNIGDAVTGGFVYRGAALGSAFGGRYFFADFVTNRVWSVHLDVEPMTGEATASDEIEHTDELSLGVRGVASFGRDAQGELYMVNLSGSIYRIVLEEAPNTPNAVFDRKDTTTQGSWKGVYGGDGRVIVEDTTELPVYATVLSYGFDPYIWQSPTADVRALQRSSEPGRLAATWYGASFDIDLTLDDGATHRVAFYAVDWDGTGREQRFDVFDGDTDVQLDTRTIDHFDGGQYLVWMMRGHVRVHVTSVAGPNAVLSGLFIGGGGGNVPPTIAVTSPPNGATFDPSATIHLVAAASDQDGSVTEVSFYANGQLLFTDTAGPFEFDWTPTAPGTYTVTAVVTDNNGASTTSAGTSITVTGASSGSSATFLSIDITRRGTWQGTYGEGGYAIVEDRTSLPSDVTLSLSGPLSYTWAASTTDDRALQRASGVDRLAATWYGPAFDVDLNFGDGAAHQVAFYMVDWDASSRQQSIDVYDAVTGGLLDSRTLAGFQNGIYVVWSLRGHVRLHFTTLDGPNAVLSGFFIGAGGEIPPSGPSAEFVTTDASTQGDWIGTHGTDGYAIVGDGTSLPAYASLAAFGHALYEWNPAPTDVRALQRPGGTGRIAATWYGAAWDLDLDLPSDATHQVAFYMVDWDASMREQRVEVVDAQSGAVLDSRTVSDFAGGKYLIWNLRGHVRLRFTMISGYNAILSGVFFKTVQ